MTWHKPHPQHLVPVCKPGQGTARALGHFTLKRCKFQLLGAIGGPSWDGFRATSSKALRPNKEGTVCPLMKCDSKQPEAWERAQRKVDMTSVRCILENRLHSKRTWRRTECGQLGAKRPRSNKRPPPAKTPPLCSLETSGRTEGGSRGVC